MSLQPPQALESSCPTSWLSQTVRRHSEQALDADAVLAVDELTISRPSAARERQRYMPVNNGVEIFSLSQYYQSYGGIDYMDRELWRKEQPEVVLR